MILTSGNMREEIGAIGPHSLNQPGMAIEPYIKYNFLSPEECIAVVEAAGNYQIKRAQLSGGLADHTIRSAGACWIDDAALPWLSSRLLRAGADICRDHYPFKISSFEEGFQFLRYIEPLEGQSGDFYDWHIDIGLSGQSCTRKLSMIIQLSPSKDYTGGELELNTDGNAYSASKQQGTLIAFPSFTLHRVCPVTSGMRHSLAVWMHGPAFR